MSFDDSELFNQIAARERDEIPEFEINESDAAAEFGEDTTAGTNPAPVGEGTGERLPPLTEDDYIGAEGILSFFDETRAMLLSMYSTGDIDSAERYQYYKDFEEGKHKYIVKAAAKMWQKFNLSSKPEYILGGALLTSSFFLWRRAEKDRKHILGEKAKEAEAKAKEGQKQAQTQQRTDPKIIEMNPPKTNAL